MGGESPFHPPSSFWRHCTCHLLRREPGRANVLLYVRRHAAAFGFTRELDEHRAALVREALERQALEVGR